MDFRGTRVHVIGIGGSGMSAAARVLLEQGALVSGSDLVVSPVARALAADGARVYEGHEPSHVQGAEIVAVSSAVPQANVELLAARGAGIRVMKRPELLGEMMRGKTGIAVAGTHGKTTTTAMLAEILLGAGCDPTIIVGGVSEGLGTNARFGHGRLFLVEADEYDHTFLSLRPTVAIVTNIEHDHPDCYPTLEDVRDAFERFADLVPAQGLLAVCSDDPMARALGARREAAGGQTISFGLGKQSTWRAEEVRPNFAGGVDLLAVREEQVQGLVRLRLPGVHNASNAMAALAIADHLGIAFQTAREALAEFRGVGRRFELIGEERGVVVVDDYAHHPTEVRAVLEAARGRYPGRRIWAVWQPHTFSRTKALFSDFAEAFGEADRVVVLPIYAARESDTLGLSSGVLATDMQSAESEAAGSLPEAADLLAGEARAGDVVLTLGAGDGRLVGEWLLERLRSLDSALDDVVAEPGGRADPGATGSGAGHGPGQDQVSSRFGRMQRDLLAGSSDDHHGLKRLQAEFGQRVGLDVPMCDYTAMRIGGPADALIVCESAGDFARVVSLAREAGIPWLVLGGGCNVLVADAGIRGLVIVCRAAAVEFGCEPPLTMAPEAAAGQAGREIVRAEAGASLAALARDTVARGVAGLEWASGLPGSVGGAVVGNAGAFEGDVASSLISAEVLGADGSVHERPAEWFRFGYRVSRLKAATAERHVLVAATFGLRPTDPEDLRTKSNDIIAWRRTRHPAGSTMGSTFKNPPGSHAGYLIEQAGLRGHRIGGAEVSPMHGNFFMNTGRATATDVKALIDHVRSEVSRQFGIELELEIEYVGHE